MVVDDALPETWANVAIVARNTSSERLLARSTVTLPMASMTPIVTMTMTTEASLYRSIPCFVVDVAVVVTVSIEPVAETAAAVPAAAGERIASWVLVHTATVSTCCSV